MSQTSKISVPEAKRDSGQNDSSQNASSSNTTSQPEEGKSSSSSQYSLPAINVNPGSSYSGRSFFGKFIENEIGEQDIQGQQSSNVVELLDLVPGVDGIGGPRKEAQLISIRGFQPSQVLLLLDGSRQNFQMSHNAIVPVRNHLLGRADVIKGGASSRFGSGALGGVISFHTIDANQFLQRPGGRSVQLRNNYSSNGEANQVSVTGGGLYGDRKKSGLVFDVTSTKANNIDQVDGNELSFSGYDDRSVWLKKNFELGNGHQFFVTAEEHRKDSTTPLNPQGPVNDDNNRPADQTETFKSIRGQYRLSRDARFRPEILVYNTQTDMERTLVATGRKDTRFVETSGLSFHSTYDLIRGDGKVKWDLQPGVELFRDSSLGDRDGGDLGLFPDGVQNSQGYYLQSQLSYDDWIWVQTGLRYDQVGFSSSSLDESRAANEASPEIELGFQVTENVGFSLSYEEGFSAPGVRQMFPDGVHFVMGEDPITGQPLFNSFIPNVDLQPEDSQTVEAKMFLDWEVSGQDEGSLRTSVYRSEVRNYIDQDFTFNTTQFVNRDLVELQGLEIELAQSLGSTNIINGFSRVRAERTFERLPLGTAPADQLSTRVEYQKMD
ncbi:MAG: TonB-dependent receptor, partial [Pseudomonadota bacterium]